MIRTICLIIPAALAFGQTAPHPTFEVASIKPVPEGLVMRVGLSGGPGTPDPGRWSTENLSIKNLITFAYDLKLYEIAAPDWTASVRFNVNAKVPAGATKEDLKRMVQALLEERFKLTFHRERQEVQGYELVIARNGPKLKESKPEGGPPAPTESGSAPPKPASPFRLATDSDGYPIVPAGRGMLSMAVINNRARMAINEMTLEMLAMQIAGDVGKPIIDATGLKGKYDVVLSWVTGMGQSRAIPASGADGPVPAASLPDDAGPTLFGALQEQLGLKLEQKKVAISLLVVDQIEKTPTEN